MTETKEVTISKDITKESELPIEGEVKLSSEEDGPSGGKEGPEVISKKGKELPKEANEGEKLPDEKDVTLDTTPDKIVNADKLEVFEFFDSDNDGFITAKDIATILKGVGATINDEELVDLVNGLHGSGKGKLTFEDFVEVLASDVDPVVDSVEEELKPLFDILNVKKDGKMVLDDFTRIMRVVSNGVSEEHISRLYDLLTKDKTGISLKDVQKIVYP